MFRVLDESAMVGMRELGKRMCNRIRKIRRNQWKLLELFTANMLAILRNMYNRGRTGICPAELDFKRGGIRGNTSEQSKNTELP